MWYLTHVTHYNVEEEHGLHTFHVGWFTEILNLFTDVYVVTEYLFHWSLTQHSFADLTNDEYRNQFLSLHRNEIDTPSIEERKTVEFDAQMAAPGVS